MAGRSEGGSCRWNVSVGAGRDCQETLHLRGVLSVRKKIFDGRRRDGRKSNVSCDTESHLLELEVMMDLYSGILGSKLLAVGTVSM